MTNRELTGFTPGGAHAAWTLVVLLVVGLGNAAWLMTTPAPRPSDSPSDSFSATRAMETLERLLGDEAPHPIGTEANAAVRSRIITELERLGLDVEIQSRFVCAAYRHYCGTVHNVLARISGRESDAVVLNAHYDSQAATPGAADAMSGVASNLEIARLLLSGETLDRDVILLFNDGEEAGLLGATAFVDHHPWAAEVVGFVNLEARGSGGPSTPAYTIGPDRRVLAPYAAGLGRHAPGSAISAATALLPAANDIVVFERLGIPGVMLGFASHIRHYHTPLDDLAHLDAGSVQQQGDAALRVLRSLVADPAPPVRGATLEESIRGRGSFVSVGPIALQWPESWTPPLAYFAAAALVVLVVLLVRAGLASGAQLAWGLIAWPITIVVAFFGSAGINFVRRAFTESAGVWVSRPEPTFFGFWAGAALLLTLATWMFRGRAAPWGLWLGGWLWWAISGAALSVFYPGLGYLFVVPTLVAVAASATLLANRDSEDRGSEGGRPHLVHMFALGAPALVAALVWLPHAWFLKDFIGLGNMPPAATLVAIGLTGALPLLAAVPRLGVLVAGLAATTAVLLAIGTRVPAFSDNAPQWANVLYATDADTGETRWFYTGFPIPGAVEEAGGFGRETGRALPWTPGDAGAVATAPGRGLTAPDVEVLETTRDGEKLRFRVRLRSTRGAPVIQFALPASRDLETVELDGVVVPDDRARFALFDEDYQVYTIWTVPDSGVVAEFVSLDPGPLDLDIADRSYGVAGVAEELVGARPSHAVPISGGDATIVTRRISIPEPGGR